jgi:hypothetical protein
MNPRSAFHTPFRRVSGSDVPSQHGEPDTFERSGQRRVSALRAAARADAGLPEDRPPPEPHACEATVATAIFAVPPSLHIDVSRHAPTEALICAHRVIRRQWELRARRACGLSAGIGAVLAMALCAAGACLNGSTLRAAGVAATIGAFLAALGSSGIAVALSTTLGSIDRGLLEEVDPTVQRRVYRICGLNPIARRYVNDVIAQGRLLTRIEVTALFSWWSKRHLKWKTSERAALGPSKEGRVASAERSPRAENAHMQRTYR